MPPEPMDPFGRFPLQPDEPLSAVHGGQLSWIAKPAVIIATLLLVAMLVCPHSARRPQPEDAVEITEPLPERMQP